MKTRSNLSNKILEWLNKQGYPTEFQVANICHRHEFRVFQGYHVRDNNADIPREIDVLANRDYQSTDHLVRVCYVVECKWSKDKPWIVLTSPHGHMASAACVAQTIGNILGSTVLYIMAGDPNLHKMELFSTPDSPGFSGRQVFSQSSDLFYSALQSIVDVSILLMAQYDKRSRPVGTVPYSTVVAFPTIVVDGQLFEAYFDQVSQQMQVEERASVRCHWRGARSWPLHSTIDVVALAHFDDFLSRRREDIEILLQMLELGRNEVEKCFQEKSLDHLTISSGPRGFLGTPPLLQEVVRKIQPDERGAKLVD